MKRGTARAITAIILTLILTLNFATATEHEEQDTENTNSLNTNQDAVEGLINSYEWLYNTTTTKSLDVQERSTALMALLGQPTRELSGIVEELVKTEDPVQHCWPKGGCKTKDSALATLALYLAGQDVTQEVKWLKDAKISMGNKGEWWLVIKSSTDGTCSIKYGNRPAKPFELEGDKIKKARGEYYINLNEIDTNILRTVTPKIEADCSAIPSTIITLIFKPDANTFFIQKSEAVTNTELIVANACYGTGKSTSTCDYESTAFASWALLEMGEIGSTKEDMGTIIYMESQLKPGNLIHLSLLNRVLLKSSSVAPSFLEELAKQQKQDGSFNGDAYVTSLAILAMDGTEKTENVGRARDYLLRKAGKDGSWNRNIRNTAFALLALHGVDLGRAAIEEIEPVNIKREICGNNIDDDNDGVQDCGEEECKEEELCRTTEEKPEEEEQEGCTASADCESGQECKFGVCIQKEEETEETPADLPEDETPPKENGGSIWVWVLILITALLVLGAIFYFKFVKTGKVSLKDLFRKKKKQTFEDYRRVAEFRPVEQPRQTQPARQQTPPRIAPQRAVKSKEEEELERSLREAEKLIKGK
ncbi:MAG TPA: hypothetical protein VJG30_02450 [Candidatus Nanoarchaeia archaeon]|nr:hypothetical protein [Candidatus Nanoarchaeia archaeon]